MKHTSLAPTLAIVTALIATGAMGQTRVDFGKRLYEENCAVCHGSTGRGEGPYRDWLKREAPDLTGMARRNGGVLPVVGLYQVIDGSAGSGHGTRDMPVWGLEFAAQAEQSTETWHAPAFVRARILALIEYIDRLQKR